MARAISAHGWHQYACSFNSVPCPVFHAHKRHSWHSTSCALSNRKDVVLLGFLQLNPPNPISGAAAMLTTEMPARATVSLQSRFTEMTFAMPNSFRVRSPCDPQRWHWFGLGFIRSIWLSISFSVGIRWGVGSPLEPTRGL